MPKIPPKIIFNNMMPINTYENPKTHKSDTTNCWWECGTTEILIHCWWDCKNGTAILKTHLAISYKAKCSLTIQYSNCIFSYLLRIIWKIFIRNIWKVLQIFSLFENYCLVAKLCPSLCYPVGGSPPSCSVHGISWKEYWNALLFPSPEDLPHLGIEPTYLA